MRIGVACNVLGRSGGMEQYALDVIETLISLGHTPVVFTMAADETLSFFNRLEVHVCPRNRWLPNKLNVVRFNHWLRRIRKTVPVEFLFACCIAATAEVAACGGNHVGYLPQTFREAAEGIGKQELRRRFNLPQDRTLFLFASSSHKRKGFDLLREYFEHADGTETLVVVGKPFKGACRNIIYAGYCSDMPAMYRAVDYTVMASIYEPFGLVPVESVWNGTPVIVSDNMGCCEVLDEQVMMKFPQGDLQAFADIMAGLRKHPVRLDGPGIAHVDSGVRGSLADQISFLIRKMQEN